ncbi:MAG: hypothetical protein H0U63_07495 [Burkholderiales bacterium]|nr:hypothetical protein [Burkholderiales bacterium]
MLNKLTVTLVASIAALSLANVYAADDKADKSDNTPAGVSGAPSASGGASAVGQASTKVWTREEALKNGLTEQQFVAADLNADGKLDKEELKAANIQTRIAK